MKLFSIARAALVIGFFALTAQSASALNCSAKVGDPLGGQATEYFLNATNDTCGGASISPAPSNDGHIIVGGPYYVFAQFFEDGVGFIPASRSLSCPGSISSNDLGTSLRVFFNTGFSTTCSLSYTDPNGQTVSHSFVTASVLDSGFYVGSTSEFSATSGWFERVSPTVAISGLPAEVNGTTPVTATITFSENVTGFTANEVSVSGGSVSNLSGIGAVYVATITPTGQSDVVVSVVAAVAQDLAGNDNLASQDATATNITATETSAVVGHFMQSRANALLANQPDLAGFLRGGAGQFAAEVTREGGAVDYSSGYDNPIWARLNANWSTDLGAESQYVFGAIGGHSKLSENLLVGGMVQFDSLSEVDGAAETSGTGWLIGPYFAAKLPSQPLYFEGSLLYGQTSNTVSPLGTYTDVFSTERYLATLGVSGQIERNGIMLFPFLDAKYTSDAQAAYTDGLSNPIAAQTIGLAQVSAGLDFKLALSAATTLKGGASGIWSYSDGGATDPGYEGGRARVDLGVAHKFSGCNGLALSGFYDGLGAVDFESYGAELKWETCF